MISFNVTLLVVALIIFICVFFNTLSSKVGIPVLLFFIVLGMVLGWNDISIEQVNEKTIEYVCTFALIFIIFYGGFDTNWKTVKPVAVEAGLLATVGVLITAGVTGILCHYILKWGWIESFLLGSVVSSTDAASVFSILKSRKMSLKNYSTQLLSVESGSNDPCSYMLTIIMIGLLKGGTSAGMVIWQLFSQLAFGAIAGLLIGKAALIVLRNIKFESNGFDSLFIMAVSLSSYALSSVIGGNGFLTVYIVGIILGNNEFRGRKNLIGFFNGITGLAQILVFYMLGYVSKPSGLLQAFVPALIIFLILSLIARPVAVASILRPFKKYPWKQIGFISFSGLRGAASIVFAIMALNCKDLLENDIFSTVFCIVLISILFQGSLIPSAAKWFKMLSYNNKDALKTFSDFQDNCKLSFGSITIQKNGEWAGRQIKDIDTPEGFLFVLLVRGSKKMIPKGDTMLKPGDRLVFGSKTLKSDVELNLIEHHLSRHSKWEGRMIKEYPNKEEAIVVAISRGNDDIIPTGDTVLKKKDILYILKPDNIETL